MLISTINSRYCGGVFIMLDATVNPAAENAETAKAGVFLKKTQLTQTSSVGVDIHHLQDPAQLARENDIMLLGQWNLEYDISEQVFFTKIMETAQSNPDLALFRLYYWSGSITLRGNSEAGFLLCVPLHSEDGTVFGSSGIEVSDRLFKSFYSPDDSIYENIFIVMAPDCEDGLCISKGLIAGNSYLTGARWENDLAVTGRHDSFTHYFGENGNYTGKSAEIRLYPGGSPYEGENWSAVLLMPHSIFHSAVQGNVSYFIGIVICLLIMSIIASIVISRRYLKPVTEALDQIKDKSYTENGTNGRYLEINDLFEFLAQKDREHEAKLSFLNEQHRTEVETHEKTRSEKLCAVCNTAEHPY